MKNLTLYAAIFATTLLAGYLMGVLILEVMTLRVLPPP